MALIAKTIMGPTSETVAGRMSVLVVLANYPSFVWRHLIQGNSLTLSYKKTGSWIGIDTENKPFPISHRVMAEQ